MTDNIDLMFGTLDFDRQMAELVREQIKEGKKKKGQSMARVTPTVPPPGTSPSFSNFPCSPSGPIQAGPTRACSTSVEQSCVVLDPSQPPTSCHPQSKDDGE